MFAAPRALAGLVQGRRGDYRVKSGGRSPGSPSGGPDCASSRHRANVCTDTPIAFATTPTLALSGGSKRATVLFLYATPYLAIFRPYRPHVQCPIVATTILTQGVASMLRLA